MDYKTKAFKNFSTTRGCFLTRHGDLNPGQFSWSVDFLIRFKTPHHIFEYEDRGE